MRWQQGRAVVEQLLADRQLERVQPSRDHADRLLGQAAQHLASAELVVASDAAGAYALLYDGARKALVAVLENQGLRPTSRGGHLAVQQAVTAQLVPPMAAQLRPFDRMRRRRRDAEYPPTDAPQLTTADVEDDLPKAHGLLDVATRVLDEMSPF